MTRWIESDAEGHVLPIAKDAPLPVGWSERPDMADVPAKELTH